MRLEAVLDAIRPLAPERLAGSWDRVGLQVGDPAASVHAAMLCIDLTEAVVEEAVAAGCGLVVAYHPMIFSPLRAVRANAGWSERRVWRCLSSGIAVYSPHTALDAVRGGVCDWLAEACGPGHSAPLEPVQSASPPRFKLVVFVPSSHTEAVAAGLWEAGAGSQGRYDQCSFVGDGTGGFRPLAGADPAVGRVGVRSEVAEQRLEVLVHGGQLADALACLRRLHPYEEPAFDVIRLEAESAPKEAAEGAGRLLTLDEPVALAALAKRLATALGGPLKLGGDAQSRVHTVALCPGSGGKLFESVQADAYVTGEMQHHQCLDLVQRGCGVLLGGHTGTERPYLPRYRERIVETAAGGIDWHVSGADVAPVAFLSSL